MVTDFRKKGNKNPYKQLLLAGGLVLIVGVAVMLLIANVRVYQKKRELATQVENLKQKVQDLKNQNSNLKESTARASDDTYIEKVAREELDLQKPGEKVFSFVTADSAQSAPITTNTGFSAWVGGAWSSFVNIFKK